jgi:phosphate transport system permease protein
MWGIPSIVYGAFGFLIMMYLGYRNSLGAGILTLSAVICPIMIRAMDEVLKTIPVGLQEAAYAIGSNKTETAFKVYLRKAFPGLVTAVLLAFSRGIGDAASVLFTAGYTDNVPTKLSDPAASLPLTIYYQFQSNSEDLQNLAYTAAILLTGIVLATSVTARLLYSKK